MIVGFGDLQHFVKGEFVDLLGIYEKIFVDLFFIRNFASVF